MTGTPAASRPRTIAATCSAVNRWARAWEPSRSVESVSRKAVLGTRAPPALARASAMASPTRTAAAVMMSRLPAYGGQVVAGALDLEQDDHPARRPARRGSRTAPPRTPAALEPVAGHVAGDPADHVLDRRRDRRLVEPSAQGAEDGVAHQDRRIGRVEDDDRLAVGGTADRHQGAGGRLGELVDVLAGARPGRAGGDGGDDLGVGHRAAAATAATIGTVAWPPQVIRLTFGRVEVLVRFTAGHDRRAQPGRRQVDGGEPGGGQPGRVGGVDPGAGRLEDQVDLAGVGLDPVDPVGGRLDPQLPGPGQAVGGRVDADQGPQLQDGERSSLSPGRCRCCRTRRPHTTGAHCRGVVPDRSSRLGRPGRPGPASRTRPGTRRRRPAGRRRGARRS